MSRRRGTPRRTDANQAEIVAALRKVGCSVLDLSAEGGGCPDLLVSFGGILHLVEIKTKNGKLNKLQDAWHDAWRGRRPIVVRSVDEALRTIGCKG